MAGPCEHRRELTGQCSFGGGQVSAPQVPQRRTDLTRQARDDVVALEVGSRQALELATQAYFGRSPWRPLARQGLEVDNARRRLCRWFLVVVTRHRGVIDRAWPGLERTLRAELIAPTVW